VVVGSSALKTTTGARPGLALGGGLGCVVPISRRPSPLLEQGDPRGALFADTDWDLRELATGHWAMFSAPEQVAEALHEIAA
jgi:hypothetical protein